MRAWAACDSNATSMDPFVPYARWCDMSRCMHRKCAVVHRSRNRECKLILATPTTASALKRSKRASAGICDGERSRVQGWNICRPTAVPASMRACPRASFRGEQSPPCITIPEEQVRPAPPWAPTSAGAAKSKAMLRTSRLRGECESRGLAQRPLKRTIVRKPMILVVPWLRPRY